MNDKMVVAVQAGRIASNSPIPTNCGAIPARKQEIYGMIVTQIFKLVGWHP